MTSGMIASAKNNVLNGVLVRSFIQARPVPTTSESAAAPIANYVPFTRSGSIVVISGQIPFRDGKMHHVGKLGGGLSIEEGQEAAKLCALNILAQLKAAAGGDLDQVRRDFPNALLLARELVDAGPTARVLSADNLLRARAMAEAWDEHADACEVPMRLSA